LVESPSLLRQDNELGPLVVRVWCKPDDRLRLEFVGEALRALAREAHVPRDVRHRQGDRRHGHRAQDLPARAGEPEITDQGVTGREQAPIEAESFQDQFGECSMA
jgi:hypothetical protein